MNLPQNLGGLPFQEPTNRGSKNISRGHEVGCLVSFPVAHGWRTYDITALASNINPFASKLGCIVEE
jgi:hypothetical protein